MVEKKFIFEIIFAIFLISLLLFVYTHYYLNSIKKEEKPELSKIQIVACYAAEKGNTCFTKLPELELVSPETCCKVLDVCCGIK